MQRSLGWVACLVLAACTQIADFDRSKIPDDDSRVDGGGGDGDGDGDMNEAGPGDGDMDAQVPGMDAATDAGVDGKVPPVCDVLTHAGCGSEQLCCDMGEGPICIDTSIDQCTVCDGKSDAGVPGPGACDTEVALSCVGRTCVCDTTTGMACSGLDQGSVCDPNTNTCIGCRSSGDCQGLPDRKTCLDGVCVECDPANNTCQGAEPICNANKECEPCNTTANNCPSPLECTAAGCVGCDPADDSGCGGSTPQCNPNGLMCVGCLVSDDCTMDPAKPICSGANVCVSCTSNEQCDARDPGTFCATSGPRNGQCGGCNPTNDDGCTDNVAGADQCNPATLTCVDCLAGAGCASGQVCLDGGNTCVQCNMSADCPAADPICNTTNHTCGDCTNVGNNMQDNAACDARADGTVCISSGPAARVGTCGECDPADDDGCTGDKGQCSPTSFSCVECVVSVDCPVGEPICDTVNDVCEACVNSAAGDATCAARNLNTPACQSNGRCGECNTRDSDFCADTEVCNTATGTCVDCTASSGSQCPGTAPICVSNVCDQCTSDTQCSNAYPNTTCKENPGTCVECTDNTHCADEATDKVCDTSTNTCVRCVNSDDCSAAAPICDPGPNTCETCTNNASGDTACAARDAATPACQADGSCDECNGREADLCSATEVCNTTTGKCVDCTTSNASQCPGNAPICVANSCDQCTSDTQCSNAYPNTTCKENPGTCVECTDNTHCADEATDKFCDTATNRCVACLASDDCPAATPICDTATHTCETCANSSAGDMACAARSTSTPACQSDGTCDECNGRVTSQCTMSETCNATTGKCVDCVLSNDAQCSASAPICISNVCSDCTTDNQCSTNYPGTVCNTSNGQCEECVTGDDCPNNQACVGFECEECQNDSDCAPNTINKQCVPGVLLAPNTCRRCDPADNEGCPSGETCAADFTCGP